MDVFSETHYILGYVNRSLTKHTRRQTNSTAHKLSLQWILNRKIANYINELLGRRAR